MENHIQEHEDGEEDHGQNHLQTLLCPQFEFVFTDPFVRIPSWQMQLLLEGIVRGAQIDHTVFHVAPF